MAKTKLKPADEKFLTKFLGDKLDFNSFDTEKITRKNPYSGVSCEVDPICAACYDFVMKLYDCIQREDEVGMKKIHPSLRLTNAVQNFDRARYIVMKLDSDAYYTLLD